MSDSLRRSTRRVKKLSSFTVGDIVELTRANATVQGRLVIKLSEEPPRWLVTFDQGSFRDEELAEEVLGPVVGKLEENEAAEKASGSDSPQQLKSTRSKKKSRSNKSDKGSGSNSSSADENSGTSESRKKKKIVSFSHSQERQPTDIDVSATKEQPAKEQPAKKQRSSRSNVSDREQRSRRRQAIIEDEVPVIPITATTATATMKRPISRGVVPPPAKKPKGAGKDEEVVKVPMLTGTLYLYRGVRRRVEFIRKY